LKMSSSARMTFVFGGIWLCARTIWKPEHAE
jgi:hypothetical protein